jgi:polyhydroxyalkanoate synthase
MYQHNRLIEPGGITLADTPIDLGRIDTPAYFLATMADHIAPWEGSYRGVKRLGGDARFTLAASGHIAGVINPPAEGGLDGGKYGYWSGPELPAEGADWLQAATERSGSWWPDWLAWLLPLSGDPVPARQPGSADHPVLEPAPGSYATTPAPR